MPNLFDVAEAKLDLAPLRIAGNKVPINMLAMNVQSAGRDRFDRIFEYIKSRNPDLLVLSEMKDKIATLDFLDKLSLYGFEGGQLTASKFDDFHTVILRKLVGKSLAIKTETLCARTAITKVDIEDGDSLYIIGIYAPAYGMRNLSKRQQYFQDLSERVLRRLCKANKNVILIGDYNLVEEAHHTHIPDEVDESREYFKTIKSHDLEDIVRMFYPSQPMYTWYSPSSGFGQRLDHVFGTMKTKLWIRELEIDDFCRKTKMSDHSSIHLKLII